MILIFCILTLICVGATVYLLLKNRQLEDNVTRAQADAQTAIASAQQQSQTAVAEAQKLIDQQFAEMQQETERIREHYEDEAGKAQEAARAQVAKTINDYEPLRKYVKLHDAEAEAKLQLADALTEAGNLRKEAQSLLEQAKNSAAQQRSEAIQKVKALRDQADALLNQATKDAGRMMVEAEKHAEQIGGDAYRALREKEMLEKASEAMRNIVEGYGDRYLVPTHSLLDDLAADFGYAAAGQSLKSARDLSRRMVEQNEAAVCDYVESSRRTTAIQFVIHAFNGRVDAVLSRVKQDNHGTLQQEIRDAFSLVNKDGQAFRNARILPAYLDARLAELKWGIVVQELARQRLEEQRALREEMREEEKRRREIEQHMRDAVKEEEMLKSAMAKAQQNVQQANEEQKAKYEQEIEELAEKLKEAEEKNQRAVSMAQQTKHGHVYIISNIGSFGDNVYKIGQTRRLVPQDRIDELSSASVPFEFNIHGMIECEDAPSFEDALHKTFASTRINKMNQRKEFFRVGIKEIRQEIEKLQRHKKVTLKLWTEEARAQEWEETRKIDSTPQTLQNWLKNSAWRNLGPDDFDGENGG
jgi:hypothetical protein